MNRSQIVTTEKMSTQAAAMVPTVICFPEDTADSTPVAGYAAVRFNAMKHRILSRLAVLAVLIDEHRPGGITERHLIEELATII